MSKKVLYDVIKMAAPFRFLNRHSSITIPDCGIGAIKCAISLNCEVERNECNNFVLEIGLNCTIKSNLSDSAGFLPFLHIGHFYSPATYAGKFVSVFFFAHKSAGALSRLDDECASQRYRRCYYHSKSQIMHKKKREIDTTAVAATMVLTTTIYDSPRDTQTFHTLRDAYLNLYGIVDIYIDIRIYDQLQRRIVSK